MADWLENQPSDSYVVSQYPANERAARAAAKANFDVDHHATDGADVGKHNKITLVPRQSSTPPVVPAGQAAIWLSVSGVLKVVFSDGVIRNFSEFAGVRFYPLGTKTVFVQPAAPPQWTQDVSANDRVLRVVNTTFGAPGNTLGGSTGGSWAIAGLDVGGTFLTIAQMPIHGHPYMVATTHTGNTYSLTSGGIVVDPTAYANRAAYGNAPDANDGHQIGGTGGGQPHAHGISSNGSWRPAYLNIIVAEYTG